jgi:hypothetical protein
MKFTLAAFKGATTVLLKVFQPWSPTLPGIGPPVALVGSEGSRDLGASMG